MKSMLTYLEGARYKLQNALAELDSRPRTGHPLAPHITITRDKSGLQQSVLKVMILSKIRTYLLLIFLLISGATMVKRTVRGTRR